MLEVRIKRKLSGFNLAVDFSIDREILSVLGPSGSGKTMTLQCIAGLVRPDEGYIALNGKVLFDSEKHVDLTPQMRKIGFVFQHYALFPHMRVRENIAYGIQGLTKKESDARVDLLLEKMHIQGLGYRYPRQISSGQQQRAALARALAAEPELLLLDEPFSALDTVRKERLELELAELQSTYNGNMLLVTHDLAQGYKLGSRMAIFDSGKIIQFGYKDEVISAPANRLVARLTGFKNLLEGTVTRVEAGNVQVMVPELGGELRAVNSRADRLKINQAVTIGIRQEYISLAGGEGENVFAFIVDKVIVGVTSINYRMRACRPSAQPCYLETSLTKSTGTLIEPGKQFHVYLPPEHITIMNS